MQIRAQVHQDAGRRAASVSTAGHERTLDLPPKANGGELLMLALATCYCNDLHREAARLGLVLDVVEVEASADFDGVGLAAKNVRYQARVQSSASREAIERLLQETDAVAEVHNTLRAGTPVQRMP